MKSIALSCFSLGVDKGKKSSIVPVVTIEMKDLKALINYLYDSQEEIDFRDDLLNLAEQIKTENRIEVKKGPLSKALSAIGVSVPDDKLVPEYASVVAHFDDAKDYQAAVNSLESPDGMEKLAELGWVMNICGDSDPGPTDYRIRFLELDLHDGPLKNDKKDVDLDKMMRDVADTFNHDEEDPKRKLQAKENNESLIKAEKLISFVLECEDEVRALKRLETAEIVKRMVAKGYEIDAERVNKILGRSSK
mgnify:CR=1 FL=1